MVVADDPLEAFGCLVGTGSQSVGHVAPKMEWGDLAAREALLPALEAKPLRLEVAKMGPDSAVAIPVRLPVHEPNPTVLVTLQHDEAHRLVAGLDHSGRAYRDGVPFTNQVKTIDSYLLDLDVVARVCDEVGSPRRGFPVMITETIYGDHLGIVFEGYPKTTGGAPCSPDGPCDFKLASEYNLAAFTRFWHKWAVALQIAGKAPVTGPETLGARV